MSLFLSREFVEKATDDHPALPTRQVHVSVLIIMVNLALYLAQLFVHGGRELAEGELIAWGANAAPLTMAGQPQRLFTSLFVHTGFMLTLKARLVVPATPDALGAGRLNAVVANCGAEGATLLQR